MKRDITNKPGTPREMMVSYRCMNFFSTEIFWFQRKINGLNSFENLNKTKNIVVSSIKSIKTCEQHKVRSPFTFLKVYFVRGSSFADEWRLYYILCLVFTEQPAYKATRVHFPTSGDVDTEYMHTKRTSNCT